jgi:hypothetical protein
VDDTPCPKDGCDGILETSDSEKAGELVITDSCTKCSYSKEQRLGGKKEKPSPAEVKRYKKLKKIFCFDEEKAKQTRADRERLKWGYEEIGKIMEKDKHKEVYQEVEKLNKLKIADLQKLLKPPIEQAGYIEVRFEKPELWPSVNVEVSCLDSKTERVDAKSRRELKRAIVKTLENTNWRLMSDGISYRLGYLSGKIRAYEDEEDLFKLVKDKKQVEDA